MSHNLGFPSRGWMARWLTASMGGAIAERLDRLERRAQLYEQENTLLRQQLTVEQEHVQSLAAQMVALEQRLETILESKENNKRAGEMDRQLSRVWQYYQDAKVQFEKINRQLQLHKTTTEETTQQLRQKFSKANTLHRSEIRDIKQQLDLLAFSFPGSRPPQSPMPLDHPHPSQIHDFDASAPTDD